jgi:hypothetical protein
MSLIGSSDNDLFALNTDALTPNRFYFVTGNKEENANAFIKALCFFLREKIVNVHCFCPEDKESFYSAFLPPCFVNTKLEMKKLTQIFKTQSALINQCDSKKDTDDRQRDYYKSMCNTLLIIDRCNFSKQDDKMIMEPEFNDLLRKAVPNRITVIYRNVHDDKWKSKIPQTLLNKSMCVCVSNQSLSQFRNVYDNFGSKIAQSLVYKEFNSLMFSKATSGHNCAIISNEEAICSTEEVNEFTEDWKQYFTYFHVPSHMNSFKMGLQEWYTNFRRKKAESECSSQNRYDSRVLEALNLIPNDCTLRVSIAPRSKAPSSVS